MSINYTWKVNSIKVRDEVNSSGETLQNAVCQTYWMKKGVDANGNEGIFNGATPFTAVNVPAELFVPFDQLTEEVVLSWIRAVVVGPYEQHVNDMITKQISDKTAVESALPWVSVPDTVPAE